MTIARLIAGRDSAIITCDSNETVRTALVLLAERRIGALPVTENGEVKGIFSERDAVIQFNAHGQALLDLRVSEVMTAPPVTVEPAISVLAALSLMTRRRIRHLPVIDDQKMVGFVSIGDLVKYRIDRIEAEAAAMRDYIQSV